MALPISGVPTAPDATGQLAGTEPGPTGTDQARPPAGCRFAPRCPEVMDECRTTSPALYQAGRVQVRCLLHSPDQNLRNGTPPPGSATGSVNTVAAGGGAAGSVATEEGSGDE